MPFPFEFVAVLEDELPKRVQLVASNAPRTGELDRIEPVFGGLVAELDMYMRRLAMLQALEEEAVTKQT